MRGDNKQINKYISKIEMNNQKNLNENCVIFNNVFLGIQQLHNKICQVCFVYDALNQLNPYVQKFYRYIFERNVYKSKCFPIFSQDINCVLRFDMLNKEDQMMVQLLNLYLKLFVLKTEIEKMIDYLEGVNINCLEN